MAASSVHRGPSAVLAATGVALVVAASVVFAALPGDLDHKLMLVLRGVCAQRPDHSFIVEGQPLALEARMYGIFVGFALSVATAWIGGRWRRSELTRGWLAAVLVLFIAVMGVDGVNAVLADLRAPHLYPPRNELRLATGLLCGVGLAGFIAPVVSFVFWREREPTPFFAGWTELAASVGVSGLAGVVVLSGMPGSVLLSAMAVAAVFASFWLINSYVAVLAWSGIGAAAHWLDLAPELIVGFVLTVGELAALAALRTWLETSLGIFWTI